MARLLTVLLLCLLPGWLEAAPTRATLPYDTTTVAAGSLFEVNGRIDADTLIAPVRDLTGLRDSVGVVIGDSSVAAEIAALRDSVGAIMADSTHASEVAALRDSVGLILADSSSAAEVADLRDSVDAVLTDSLRAGRVAVLRDSAAAVARDTVEGGSFTTAGTWTFGVAPVFSAGASVNGTLALQVLTTSGLYTANGGLTLPATKTLTGTAGSIVDLAAVTPDTIIGAPAVTTGLVPDANDGAYLGTTALGWADLHLATGAVLNWANGEVTITETDANTLTLAGATLVDVAAGILELNDAVRFDTGVAMVAASYSVGRDADATNQLHLNVPTGASFEFSVNDVGKVFIPSGGGLGLGTATVPHGGVGAALLALEGTNASASGPHIQITTAADDYPLLDILAWTHDAVEIGFDAYNAGTGWYSSDAGSNFRIAKGSDALSILSNTGDAAGAAIADWSTGFVQNAAGNVGVGVTPASWHGTFTALQIGGNGALSASAAAGADKVLEVSQNAYLDLTAADWKYISTDEATKYTQIAGAHIWYKAGSGTAGTLVSWTEAARIDASGNLGIGVTPKAWDTGLTVLQVGGLASLLTQTAATAGNGFYLNTNAYYDDTDNRWEYMIGAEEAASYAQYDGLHTWQVAAVGTNANDPITFTRAMTLTNAGQLLVGTATASANAAGPSVYVQQGAGDDAAEVFASTDVEHGLTGLLNNTNAYGAMQKVGATGGGLMIQGASDADATLGANTMYLVAYAADALIDSTDTSSSTAVTGFDVYQTNGGTGGAALSAAENAYYWMNAGTTVMLLKGGGVLHLTNATPSALDYEDDTGMIRLIERERSAGVLMSEWDNHIKAKREDLHRVGVMNEDGSMLALQPYLSLLGGGVWEVKTDVYSLEERFTALERRTNELQMQLSWRDLHDTATALSRN